MSLKRTTVFADEDDLAVLKAAALRRGVGQAELIRDAIHLAAMANRVWDEPFFRRRHSPLADSTDARADDIWAQRAQEYVDGRDRLR